MIDCKDLRVGNVLQYYIGEEGCEWDYNTIDAQDILWCQEKNENFNKVHRGVELSGEVLGKIEGFKKGKIKGVARMVSGFDEIDPADRNKYTYYWDLKIPKNDVLDGLPTFSLVQFGKGADILWKDQMRSVKVKHLHHLMNLYHSLTQIELVYHP